MVQDCGIQKAEEAKLLVQGQLVNNIPYVQAPEGGEEMEKKKILKPCL